MKKVFKSVLLLLCTVLLMGCADNGTQKQETGVSSSEDAVGNEEETAPEKASGNAEDSASETAPADGTYTAEFYTDSGMFHVNEACDGRGTLTVENGEMTIHISLVSKNIVNLYPGLAEDAGKEGAELLSPTEDTVTYSDGLSEEVYGFDVPVPALEEEFDLALIGTKGKWYDHKVSVSNPVPSDGEE